MDEMISQDIAQETPAENVFIAPSIHKEEILAGASYTHHSSVPEAISNDLLTECVLGVDEAGRGPVLGNLFQLVSTTHKAKDFSRAHGLRPLLSSTHKASDASCSDPPFR